MIWAIGAVLTIIITILIVGKPHDHDQPTPQPAPSPPVQLTDWEQDQIRMCELLYRDEDIKPINYDVVMRP